MKCTLFGLISVLIIEFLHVIFYKKTWAILYTVDKGFKELQRLNVDESVEASKIMDKISMDMFRKYFLIFGVELYYWITVTMLLFELPIVHGITSFGIVMCTNVVNYFNKVFGHQIKYYVYIHSILCILVFITDIFIVLH